ncbi:dihydrofolate reductase family protein [Lentzea sp. NBC_00516]|uniref:dihydrofolate reductase family protein n=1 Tax=Lentzea sp. NBC_00516 TaxID=2903582 RepID=UPI002E817B0D|nr:dihydrofolate reductase family protein [Lentzea sp. NBC_00516]WUD28785.1 dihydrofolate reductase family protein [Lentzea sp. NBC_00516]
MIITMASVSLDGFFEDPDHDIGWHHMSDELHSHVNAELAKMSRFLNGRRNHELMLQAWPHAEDNPGWPRAMLDFAPIWRDMPKIVYSRTRRFTDWNTETRTEVVPDEIRKLEGDSMVGGNELLQTFFEHNLVDEIRLYVNPAAIGGGTPFFQKPNALALKGTRAFDNGVVLLTYGRR